MNFEEFEFYIKNIEEYIDSQERVAEFFHKEFAPESHRPAVTFGDKFFNAHLKIVAEIVGDNEDWIGYWLWECDRGKSPGKWQTKEGKEFQMRNHSDLWFAINYKP